MNISESERIYQTDNIVCNDRYIYYYAEFFYCLIRIDRISGNTSYYMIPHCYHDIDLPFRTVAIFNDIVMLIPFHAREFCLFDTVNEQFSNISIPEGCFKKGEVEGFEEFIRVGNYLFFYGWHPVILRYDIMTGKMFCSRKFEGMLPAYCCQNFMFEKGAIHKDKKIYFFIGNYGCIVETDVDFSAFNIIEINNLRDTPLKGIGFDEFGNLWALPLKTSGQFFLIKYVIDKKYVERHFINNVEMMEGVNTFLSAALYERTIILLAGNNDRNLLFDIETEETTEIKLFEKKRRRDNGTWYSLFEYFVGLLTMDGHFLTIDQWEGCILDINLVSHFTKRISIKGDFCRIKNETYHILSKRKFFFEDTVYGNLENFIGTIICS